VLGDTFDGFNTHDLGEVLLVSTTRFAISRALY